MAFAERLADFSNVILSRRSRHYRRCLAALAIGCLCLAVLASASAAPKKWRVALVLPGSISDHGFNEVAYQGLQQIHQQLGADTSFSENTAMANYERVIRGFAEEGNDIIICRGLEFDDLVAKIAPDYPKQYFIVSDGHDLSGPNFISVEPRTRDAAFLAGVLAGLTTKTNKIGIVIGFDYPMIVADAEAFRWALRSVNPKAELQVIYLGSFDDVARGKEAALVEIGAGCDIIDHNADTAGIGVIQAGVEKGVKVIGYGADQNHVAPKTVYATEVLDPAYMMSSAVKDIMAKRFDGKARVYGLDSPGISLGIAPGFVSPEVLAQVDRWKQAILSGALTIPLMTTRDSGNAPLPAKLPAP
jgi:basic membrane protein A